MESKKIDVENESVCSQEKAILYSNNLLKAFDLKSEEFNKEYDQNVTADQIKSIYINAVQYEANPELKNAYAFARINLFFDMIIGKESFLTGLCNKISYAENEVSSLEFAFEDSIKETHEERVEISIDLFEKNTITEEYYSKARKDIKKYQIDFCLNSIEDELFLMKNTNQDYLWEIL
jgi:hypothetical protein